MLKFLGLLALTVIAFGFGLYVGLQGPDSVMHKAKKIGAGVLAKTVYLERELSLRTSLVNAKERLVQAKSDLLDKNFGKASTGLDEAAQALKAAKESAGEESRESLDKIMEEVSAARRDAQKLKAGLQAKVDGLVKELDQMLAR